jgi:hypothetical protein
MFGAPVVVNSAACLRTAADASLDYIVSALDHINTNRSLLKPTGNCLVKGYKAWNSKLWGDRPLVEYLPKHVTLDDYKQAVEYLEAGYDIHIHGIYKDWSLQPRENGI